MRIVESLVLLLFDCDGVLLSEHVLLVAYSVPQWLIIESKASLIRHEISQCMSIYFPSLQLVSVWDLLPVLSVEILIWLENREDVRMCLTPAEETHFKNNLVLD